MAGGGNDKGSMVVVVELARDDSTLCVGGSEVGDGDAAGPVSECESRSDKGLGDLNSMVVDLSDIFESVRVGCRTERRVSEMVPQQFKIIEGQVPKVCL